ncbi:hypothetical protein AGMMS50230_11980 [Spirochaetia bacterium]|nr:hypothetical protein AGMMS50230_11980 [Spirochaetia bacterium]
MTTALPAWGQNTPFTLYVQGGLHYYAFPSNPVDKSYPGFRLGGGLELPLAVLFKEVPGYLSGGLETGFRRLTVKPSGETLSLVPVTLALMYRYPFKSLNGRFTLGAGFLTGGTAAIAKKNGFLFLVGPRLEGSYQLWDGELSGSIYLGLGLDIIPQRKTVILPAASLGLRLRVPLGTAAKPSSLETEHISEE